MIEEVSNYLNSVRHDFSNKPFDESDASDNPMHQFAEWFEEAVGAQVLDPKAMVISTVDNEGMPHSRVVYNRGIRESGIVFYTNYNSQKGGHLDQNNRISVNYFWPELERQIRFNGTVEKLTDEESNTYFKGRPRASKIGAWASEQSDVIAERSLLEHRVRQFTAKFEGEEVPRPPHWGGYLIRIALAEFWQGRPSRLHDRIRYELRNGEWTKARLAP